MYASSVGNVAICNLLLANGAQLNAVDKNKDHALNWATYSGKVAVMQLLIKNPSNIVTSKLADM